MMRKTAPKSLIRFGPGQEKTKTVILRGFLRMLIMKTLQQDLEDLTFVRKLTERLSFCSY